MSQKAIYLDMDGTFVDLYSVENWLEDLRAESVRPYVEAQPLVNMSGFARVLNRLHRDGWSINIISWTSRGGSPAYNEAVKAAKLEWLAQHLPSVKFDSINIVEYGMPKSLYGSGFLFDDEERNRNEWEESPNNWALPENQMMFWLKAF